MAASHLRSAGTWHRTGMRASRRPLAAEFLDDLAAELALDEVHAGQRVAAVALAARRVVGLGVLGKVVVGPGGPPLPPGRLRLALGRPAGCCLLALRAAAVRPG